MNKIPQTPPPRLSGVLSKLLSVYCDWQKILKHIPKDIRYSLAVKIDALFCGVIESSSLAQFSVSAEKIRYITKAISQNDTLKFMFYVIYEVGGIDTKKLEAFTEKLEEIGRMLFGWKGQTLRKTASHTL